MGALRDTPLLLSYSCSVSGAALQFQSRQVVRVLSSQANSLAHVLWLLVSRRVDRQLCCWVRGDVCHAQVMCCEAACQGGLVPSNVSSNVCVCIVSFLAAVFFSVEARHRLPSIDAVECSNLAMPRFALLLRCSGLRQLALVEEVCGGFVCACFQWLTLGYAHTCQLRQAGTCATVQYGSARSCSLPHCVTNKSV